MTEPQADYATTRKQWAAARNTSPYGFTIGGSEVAAVLGWSKYEDPIALYGRKLGLIEPPPDDAPSMAGRFLERGILDWYAHETGRALVTPAVVAEAMKAGPNADLTPLILTPLVFHLQKLLEVHYGPDRHGNVIFRSKDLPWATMTIDAFAADKDLGWGVVDAKNLAGHKREEWRDGVPADKAPQIVHYAGLCDLAWGGFAVVFGGQDLQVFDVRREDMQALERLVVEECTRFVQEHLAFKRVPNATPSKASADALVALFKDRNPAKRVGWAAPVVLGDGSTWSPERFDEEWVEVSTQCNAWQCKREALKAVALHVMQDASAIVLPDGTEYRMGKRSIIRRAAK